MRFGHQQVKITAPGTPKRFSAGMAKWMMLRAASSNTGIIAVGGASVSASVSGLNSVPYSAGDSLIINEGSELFNFDEFYADGTVTNDILAIFYELPN